MATHILIIPKGTVLHYKGLAVELAHDVEVSSPALAEFGGKELYDRFLMRVENGMDSTSAFDLNDQESAMVIPLWPKHTKRPAAKERCRP